MSGWGDEPYNEFEATFESPRRQALSAASEELASAASKGSRQSVHDVGFKHQAFYIWQERHYTLVDDLEQKRANGFIRLPHI